MTEPDVQPLSVGGHLASEDDSALVDRVILDELLSKPGAPVPSRFEMLMTGMSVEDVDTAIAEWEALGRPERPSGETHSDERVGPEAGGGAPRQAEEERSDREPPVAVEGSEQETEFRGDMDAPVVDRTSSAIWETPPPSLKPLGRHRNEWARYDDLHGYGRSPRMFPVTTPAKEPGIYAALLHPDTRAAYERERRQAEGEGRRYDR